MNDEERRQKKAAYMREWRKQHPAYQTVHPEWQRRSRAKHREKVRERWRKDGKLYYERHPERVQANTKRRYQRRKATDLTGLRLEAVYWKHHYDWGLTREQFEELKPRMDGPCEICGAMVLMCIDHDHATRTFRGLLCRPCNYVLGYARDNADVLRQAIEYLVSHAATAQ